MDKSTHPYFVPDDTQGSRRETAILLTGTATEFGIEQREVAATQGGFRISENVYKALGWDEDDETPETTGSSETRMPPGDDVSNQSVLTGQVPVPGEQPPLADVNITDDGFEGTDSTETQYDNGDLSPADDDDADDADDDDVLPYDQWEYSDLVAEVGKRDINTPDRRAATLVAALTAYDDSLEADDAAQAPA